MPKSAKPTMEFRELRIADLSPSPHNPRKIPGGDTDPSLDTLAASIERQGVIEPILVRRKEGAWEILAGERRWRCSRRVFGGSGTIPAMVRDVDDHAALEITVVENLERSNLHPLEEAAGIAALVGDGWDVARIADRLGREKGWVARRARLTKPASWARQAEEEREAAKAKQPDRRAQASGDAGAVVGRAPSLRKAAESAARKTKPAKARAAR